MRIAIGVAAAATAALLCIAPAVAKPLPPPAATSGFYADPNSGGGVQPWWSTAPSSRSIPCTEILARRAAIRVPRSNPAAYFRTPADWTGKSRPAPAI